MDLLSRIGCLGRRMSGGLRFCNKPGIRPLTDSAGVLPPCSIYRLHRSGIQQRRVSWQDRLLGTNCPIPPKWNWTYQFQVKDQIGSFYYFPSLHFQRAAGGFGSFVANNRPIISIPFSEPDGDIVILIGDWYTRNHTALRKTLDDGKDLGIPDGVLINGKGPYRYNNSLVPDGIDHETIEVHPGKTLRWRTDEEETLRRLRGVSL